MGLKSNQAVRFFIAMAVLVLLPALKAFSAEVFIDVQRKRGSAIKVAIPEFLFKPSAGQAVEETDLTRQGKEAVTFDLDFSSYFEVIDNQYRMDNIVAKEKKSGKADWKGWKSLGADTVVRAEYSFTTNGNVVIEGRLYDVERKEQIIGVRYTGKPEIFRKMVHRFADQILYRFTGEVGIAETRIGFLSKVNKRKELFITDYDGENMIQLTNEKTLVLSPSWSPVGDKILFTTYRYKNPDLYGIDLIKGTRYAISRKIGVNSSASWSPDGKEIAFSMSSRGNSDIYLINKRGKNLRRITLTRSIETSPEFSPDGKRLVYVSDFSGTPQVYLMSVTGKNKQRFTFSGSYNADPAWSPKGDIIAYAGMKDNNFNIHVKKVNGKFEKQLTIYHGTNESPTWSPDGRNIAFASNRSGSRQIYIMNSDGENQRQVTSLPGEGYAPTWGPFERKK